MVSPFTILKPIESYGSRQGAVLREVEQIQPCKEIVGRGDNDDTKYRGPASSVMKMPGNFSSTLSSPQYYR